ncbi:nitrous oxide reductase accessory protein NosL [Cupriavidus sp. SZY C1]|uniref:nitrous oxide reductase accessory protein NosL n=1 Tax=Cupriavidus sp. SZY C1 TaxID=3055037 RepID=UPI0028B5ABC7|nr:nitrous oxide reductase accessory protein NosL [Cupriavidus sp. SZY C1]MDT6960208.1 nitrous oxide reductase accessory protein NosL [Cupriavidus sp. SZY C1]
MTHPHPTRRVLLAAISALPLQSLLAACSRPAPAAPTPADFDPATACDLDGMLLADHPGPKAQIFFAGQAAPVWYCDTVELFSTLLRPEQVRPVTAVFTQDMELADWNTPRGHWFDARTGFYVTGSRRHGAMGPTIPGFRNESAAQAFAHKHGGKVLPYAGITADMVDLSGGAGGDGRM